MLVDTHAHLQWATFQFDRGDVLMRAREAGVEKIVNIGFDYPSSLEAVKLAGQHEGLFAAVGVHPHNASKLGGKIMENLRILSRNEKVVAVGEIGLDYYRNLSPREDQLKAFEAQMILAEELDLPVVIHDREAHKEVLEMLLRFKDRVRGVMHCFSGSRRMAEKCVQLDFHISLAGPVTFPSSRRLHDVARWVKTENLLLETDCPWLSPQSVRGRRNEPAFLLFTANKIAELKGISTEKLAYETTENAAEIFHI